MPRLLPDPFTLTGLPAAGADRNAFLAEIANHLIHHPGTSQSRQLMHRIVLGTCHFLVTAAARAEIQDLLTAATEAGSLPPKTRAAILGRLRHEGCASKLTQALETEAPLHVVTDILTAYPVGTWDSIPRAHRHRPADVAAVRLMLSALHPRDEAQRRIAEADRYAYPDETIMGLTDLLSYADYDRVAVLLTTGSQLPTFPWTHARAHVA